MKQQSMTLAAWIALLALAFVWGGSFLAFALGLRELPVFTLVAHRVFWGCILLWMVTIYLRIKIPTSPKIWFFLIVMGLLNNVIPFSLIAWGQLHIESGLASIFNAATAIFGVLLAAVVFVDERLTSNKVAGVIMAFIGVCITMGWDALSSFDIQSIAQLAIIGATISYAAAAVWARATFKGLNPIVAATGMVTGSCLIILPLALYIDGPPSFDLTLTTWGAVAFIAGPCTAIAYLLYYRALNLAGSGNLSLVTLLVTPMAVFWGWAVFGEQLTINAFIGFGFVAFGMLILDGRILKHLKFSA